jgi:hypothetical protein
MRLTLIAILGLACVTGCSMSSEPVETGDDAPEATESAEQAATAATHTWKADSWESCHDMCGGSCSCLSPHTSTNPAGKACAPVGAQTWYVPPTSSRAQLFFCQ